MKSCGGAWRHRDTDGACHLFLTLRKYGEKTKPPVAVHPHMLRHACGYALAEQAADTQLIQAYFGHRTLQHNVCYTATNQVCFE